MVNPATQQNAGSPVKYEHQNTNTGILATSNLSFQYPQLYIDPLTNTSQVDNHQLQSQKHLFQHSQSQLISNDHVQSILPNTNTIPTSQQTTSFYLHDPSMTTMALQQMQLQMQVQMQLQVQQQQQQDKNTSQSMIQSPSVSNTTLLNSSSSSITNNQIQPLIPESQMASAYRIGRYTPAERQMRLERYRGKRKQRNYNRRVKYDCRKMIADKRKRVQGRFVKREQEMELQEQDDKSLTKPQSSASASSSVPNPLDCSSITKQNVQDQHSFSDHSDGVYHQFP